MRAMKSIQTSSAPDDGARLTHPSVARNKAAILEALRPHVPATGTILEIASGTGEHAAYLSAHLAPGRWLPSDPDPGHRRSIAAWRDHAGHAVLLPPLDIDATAPRWPVEETPPAAPVTAIVAINMIHIAPWAATVGLMAAAGRILPQSGILYLYGAYRIDGRHTAESNIAFEQWLKGLDPAFGVRDMGEVATEAGKNGLHLTLKQPMPANNFSLVFTKE
jgi:hypothetical protein